MNTSSSVVTLMPYDLTPNDLSCWSKASNNEANMELLVKGNWITISVPTSVRNLQSGMREDTNDRMFAESKWVGSTFSMVML